jgi:hypothetical protein
LVRAGLANARGPESKVTLAVVERVGKRFSVGVPLEFALALEKEEIQVSTFQKAVEARSKLSTRWRAAHGKFLLLACQKILAGKGDTVGARWLLTRRWPQYFTTQEERGEAKESGTDETRERLQRILDDARKFARLRMEGEEK